MVLASLDRLRITQLFQIATLLSALVATGGAELSAQCTSCDSGCCDSSCDAAACGGCGSCGGFDIWSGLCDGDCRCREHLLGDWLGARSCLADHGIIVDNRFTQFFQGVASGGRDQEFEYSGKFDSLYTFEGEKLGLNKGFLAFMHAEYSIGNDVNFDAGLLAFPNGNTLWPLPGETEIAISGLFMIQALTEKISLTAGKYNGLDLFNMLYPSQGRGIDGFMNANFLIPLTLLRTFPLSVNGAGILGMKGEQIQSALLVYDTQNSSTTIAPDLFGQGSVVIGYHRFFTKFGGKDGSQGFLANYSNATYASTDPLSYTVIPGEGIAAGRKKGSWSLGYFADQLLYVDRCNPNRNLRFFSQWGLADKKTSPYAWVGTVALQGSGLVHGRPADTMGVGYFYNGLSSDFKDLVSFGPLPDIQDVQGVELFYNATVRPWFHLTTDLQVIDNEQVADNTALVLGIRASMDL